MKFKLSLNPFTKTKQLNVIFSDQVTYSIDADKLLEATTTTKVADITEELSNIKLFIEDATHEIKNTTRLDSYTQRAAKHLNTIKNIESKIEELRVQAQAQIEVVEYAKPFIESVKTSNHKVFEQRAAEDYRTEKDLNHKVKLTLLRIVQIFLYITMTYMSVTFATWLMGQSNLVIPRGLINIIPSIQAPINSDKLVENEVKQIIKE
jgi:hypothetical protein